MSLERLQVRYKGELVYATPLCEKHGISLNVLNARRKANPKVAVEHLLYPVVKNKNMFNIRGKWMTAKEICKKFNIKRGTFQGRLNRYFDGDNIMDLIYPVNKAPKNNSNFVLHEYKGQLKSYKDWALESPRKYQSFMIAVKKNGLAWAIEAPIQSAQEDIDITKPGKTNPDISSLEWNPDLELTRQITAYKEMGMPDSEIYFKLKRKSYG